ncbi:levanase [Mucilaginibacter lappiensis]|uniref:Levanase/fructan beta-fructosidase n=1 Tax=Mucilaginibacter lappiensis TaxID=354630 RepID=A0ABR6PDR7_9SPHI|nr:glycoside hydrolase family 32 protein [Mucilaginibacter lappiensis]MBB6107899.1 levanase/fructan beta-fructosidase [Mucilaginibacter lappiensis]SIP93304.1 levanase [Mucilaginibacter lappiensis]
MNKAKLIIVLLFAISSRSFAQQETATPQWRPTYHFTPPTNWTNDPNGLIYLNGEFNLYYQHNPFENKWGHMSWGHATSKDLIHWKHLPVAIPEILSKDTTTWIYSGSAVLDKNNTSGFGLNGQAPIVAIFTADQPKQKKESQFIAYSNDNALSYNLYANNPVIDLQMHDFRDPNVFWYEPTKQWIMTVAMVDEHMVRIYGSKDLKKWTKLSDFGPAGYTKNGWECPSLIPLSVDGDPTRVKWVLFVSSGGDHGPLMQYYIGDFDGVTFKNNNPTDKVLTVDYGDAFYAAIAWRDAPGNKKILLGWLQNGRKETYPWKGQMSIPHDLYLKTTDEGLKLIQIPSTIISNSLSKLSKGKKLIKEDISLTGRLDLSGNNSFNNNANWLDVEFNLGDAKKVGVIVAEKMGSDQKITVGYDVIKKELYVDCTRSESGNKDTRNLIQTAPMRSVNGVVRMQVLIDKSSLEVFGNSGEKVISTMIYPNKDATGISLFSDGKTMVRSLKVWDLNNANK